MTPAAYKKPPGGARGRNSSVVADVLRKKILSLELRPGQALDEVALSAKLGVSRTPMREALIRLAAENLVEITPNRGARVTTINLPDIRELFEVLEVVQGITTRWAALRRDDSEIEVIESAAVGFQRQIADGDLLAAVQSNFDFHVAVARAAKNFLLESHYSNLLSRTFRLGLITFNYLPLGDQGHLSDIHAIESDHMEIVDAIRRRDQTNAERIARRHARDFLKRVTEYMVVNLADEVGVYLPTLVHSDI